ncbi:unnamed protein product [Closterium sp. NIES-64]|nr:unnamed protein product [Closterium sp. NIES-64]
MTDDSDEGVIVQRDLPEAGEDGDSEDDLNLDEMLGYMQQLKQSEVKLGKKKKKKKGRLSTLLANSSSDGAGPSSTPTDTAAETTPATTAAFTAAAVTELAAPSDSPMPLAASTGTTTDASAAVSIPVGATTEITPAVTVVNAASVSTPSPNTALASAGAANQTSTVADASGVTAAAADNPTAGTAAGRVVESPLGFSVPANARSIVPADHAAAVEAFRLQGHIDDLRTTLRQTQECEKELSKLLSEHDAEVSALNQRCAEFIRLNEQLIQDVSAAQGTGVLAAPRHVPPTFNMDRIPRDANGVLIIPPLVSHDQHFGRKATEAFTYLLLDAPARSMQLYPEWAEFREVVCMKYENAGVQSDVFYYVISNDPNKEALAMRKVSEKRSNVNSDAKTFGRGPGGCVPESKWKILAEENVAPSTSRTPMEWGRLTPAQDTAEAVNRRNVALKIDQVAAWIKATYDAGDVAIWDSRPPASFNMSPVIKILVEGFESIRLEVMIEDPREVMIEDPREVERRRQMGIENEIGCSYNEIVDAFREVCTPLQRCKYSMLQRKLV